MGDTSSEQSRARRSLNSIPRPIPQFDRCYSEQWTVPRDTNTLRSAGLCIDVIQEYAYKPEKVAIGPQHFREKHLGSYEHFKFKFVECRLPHIMSRFNELSGSIDAREIRQWCSRWSIQCLARDPDEQCLARDPDEQCMAKDTDVVFDEQLSDEQLISMMAIDGLFLLQILRSMSPSREGNARASNYMSQTRDSDVARFFQPLLRSLAVKRDIMKIKNQIPIFVLQKILDWEVSTYQYMMFQWNTTPGGDPQAQETPGQDPQASTSRDPVQHQILADLIQELNFQLAEEGDQSLSSILQRAWQSLSPFPYISADVHLRLHGNFMATTKPHLLEVVYHNIIGSKRVRTNDRGSRHIRLPRAAELTRKRRVKFSAYKGPLDGIRFDSKTYTFHLPIIEMHEGTLTLMKNLLEFEGHLLEFEGNLLKFEEIDANESTVRSRISTPIHRYVELMCKLINKEEDVEVLRDSGIIFNHSGTDQDLTDLWHGIHTRCVVGQYEPIDTATADIRVYTRKYRIMCAELKENYFSKPWVTLSVIGAWIVFIFTGFQTYFSWKQYVLQLADTLKNG